VIPTVLGCFFGALFRQKSSPVKMAAGFDALADKAIEVDEVGTNPPFRLNERFVICALEVAGAGGAILARTVFIESVRCYSNLFRRMSPSSFAQFTERVPMVRGVWTERQARRPAMLGWPGKRAA
jgi:hypothetical protein